MSEHVSEEALNSIFTNIDDYCVLKLLKFVAHSVVKSGVLESCSCVLDVYRKIRDSLKDEDYRVAVSFLRHFLQITGCPQATELSAHCCEEFDLTTRAPYLSSYHLLLRLAYKTDRNNNYSCLLESVDQSKLSKSKYELYDAISTVELFQSMIYKGTLHPDNINSLKQELAEILKGGQLQLELNFVQNYNQQDEMTLLYDFEGHSISGEFAIRVPVSRPLVLHPNSDQEVTTDTDTDLATIHVYSDDGHTHNQSIPLLQEPKNDENGSCVEMVKGARRRRLSIDDQMSDQSSDSEATNSRRSLLSPWSRKRAISCCCVNGVILISMIAAMVFSFYYAAKSSSDLSHLQPIYGYRPNPFIYSPFSSSINLFYYTSVRGVIHGDSAGYTYNVTLCSTSCPLVTSKSQSSVVGECPMLRYYNNCYVRLLNHNIRRTDSQYYSRYMLKNSKMTLIIFEQSHVKPVQLCITNDNVTCDQVFSSNNNAGSLMECPQVLDFNQTNNYSQTFTAPADSYYCAVWLIEEANHSINYTIELEVISYQSPTSGQCKNFNINDFTLELQSHRLKVVPRYQDVCIFVQNNAINQGSATLSMSVTASWFQNLAFVFGIIVILLFIISMIVIAAVFCFNCYKYMKRK